MKQSTKNITTVAVMVALLICVQLVLSMIAGVELVTILFVTFSICHGRRKALLTAVGFSLLRCVVFGSIVSVIALYLIHFCIVAVFFGSLGKTWVCKYPFVIVFACLSSVMFTMIDNFLAPLFYSVDFTAYFIASLPVMLTQVINVAITFAILFLPVKKAFDIISKD